MISPMRRELYYWEHLSRAHDPGVVKLDSVTYVAGAFSASTPQGVEDNIDLARIAGIKLMLCGYPVIIPHANTAGMEALDWPHGYWLEMDIQILRKCDNIFMLAGWHTSKGAGMEYDFAVSRSINIVYEPNVWDLIHTPDSKCTPGLRDPFTDEFVPLRERG